MPKEEKISVLNKVAEEIAKNGTSLVENEVVEFMVMRQVTKWKDPLVQVLDKLQELRREHGKFHADQKAYDQTGKVISETFSKGAIDSRNKISEQITRIEKAIELAFSPDQDFSKIIEIAKNLKSGGGGGGKPAGEDTPEG
jgi:flagellar biosynthesis/type III secretory pathway chaperone